MLVANVVFWGSLGLLGWVYAGYPAVAWAYGLIKPVRLQRDTAVPDYLTVGVAVYDGAAEIAERIADVFAQKAPFEIELIVACDGSDEATTEVVRDAARADGRIRLVALPRVGQSAAQGAIFEAARGAVVVLTDLETRFERGCLAALVAPMRDPRIGCVTGVLRWRYDAATRIASQEGLYWRYEQAVRRWESRAGWLSAGTGALLAVRKSLYRPVPAHASLDDMLPLMARENAQIVLVAPDAVGTDRGTATLREELDSRMRMATQGIEANLRMALRVRPWTRPGTWLAISSHKILRWATPLLGLIIVGTGAYHGLATGQLLYFVPGMTGLGLVFLALVEVVASRRGRSIPVASFALTALAVNWSFAAAWVNVVFRQPIGAWERSPAQRGFAERASRAPDD